MYVYTYHVDEITDMAVLGVYMETVSTTVWIYREVPWASDYQFAKVM